MCNYAYSTIFAIERIIYIFLFVISYGKKYFVIANSVFTFETFESKRNK